MPPSHKGLRELFTYPLMSAIFDRRTRRVARGTSIVSGPISYTSPNKPAPLSPLEEAILDRLDRADRQDDDARRAGEERGRQRAVLGAADQRPGAVGQQHRQRARRVVLPDQRRRHVADQASAQPGRAGARSASCRRGGRTGPRPTGWPRPRASSTSCTRSGSISRATGRTTSSGTARSRTVPGTTILLPIVDLTRQFINVVISLLSEEDGQRPLFVDDWQRFRPRSLLDWGAWFGSLVGLVPNISYQIIGGAKRGARQVAQHRVSGADRLRQHAAHRLRDVLPAAEPDAHRPGHGARRVDPRRRRRALRVRARSGQGQVRHRVPDAEAEEVAALAAAADARWTTRSASTACSSR